MRHHTVETNGISMHYVEAGEGPLVICCHGFPETWHSWRHQISALARAGYRVVVPDQRGYGRTEAPDDPEAYNVRELAADLIGLLDALGEERAAWVGHDFGAEVLWSLVRWHPERTRGIVAMAVPFVRRSKFPTTAALEHKAGDHFHYILYFQEPGPADAELNADPKALIAAMYNMPDPATIEGHFPRGSTRFFDVLGDPRDRPGWYSEADLDAAAAEFERTTFTPALNWYRCMDRNWELIEPLKDTRVECPALFIAGARDVIPYALGMDAMDEWLADLRGKLLLEGAGHWVQQERPDEVNGALVEFLGDLD